MINQQSILQLIIMHPFFLAVLPGAFTFLLLGFIYVLRPFTFWKVFLYWFALLFLAVGYFFVGVSGGSVSTDFIAGLILALPISLLITYFSKWRLEAHHGTEENKLHQKKIWKWYLFLCLGIYLFSPIYASNIIYATPEWLYSFLGPLFGPLSPRIFFPVLFGWSILNVGVFIGILAKGIERISLWLPILSLFIASFFILVHPIENIPWNFLSILDSMTLGVAIHLLFRK